MEFLGIQILPFVIFAQKDDQALVMSQRNRRGNHLQVADKTVIGVVVGMQPKGQHASETAVHLFCGDLVSLVSFQSGVCHKADTLYRLEVLCHLQCVGIVLPHPQGQGNCTTHDEPCVKRADRRTQIHL